MRCKDANLCKNFVLSSSVTVEGGNLVINIPGIICNKGCLAIAQVIPDAATVNLPVVITIADGTTQYPLVDKCGIQLTAGRIDIRRRYSFKYITSNSTSVFRIEGTRCPYNVIPVLPS